MRTVTHEELERARELYEVDMSLLEHRRRMFSCTGAGGCWPLRIGPGARIEGKGLRGVFVSVSEALTVNVRWLRDGETYEVVESDLRERGMIR